MSRGLGKTQRKIIEILKYEREEWCGVNSIAYQVVYGKNVWEKKYNIGEEPERPDKSMMQSIWQSVRRLEKRKILESRDNTGDYRINYASRGGATRRKEVKLTI